MMASMTEWMTVARKASMTAVSMAWMMVVPKASKMEHMMVVRTGPKLASLSVVLTAKKKEE